MNTPICMLFYSYDILKHLKPQLLKPLLQMILKSHRTVIFFPFPLRIGKEQPLFFKELCLSTNSSLHNFETDLFFYLLILVEDSRGGGGYKIVLVILEDDFI